MKIDATHRASLKEWLCDSLRGRVNADLDVLSDYVLALLGNVKKDLELQQFCEKQLDDFLKDGTKAFVVKLFDHLRSEGLVGSSSTDDDVDAKAASVEVKKDAKEGSGTRAADEEPRRERSPPAKRRREDDSRVSREADDWSRSRSEDQQKESARRDRDRERAKDRDHGRREAPRSRARDGHDGERQRDRARRDRDFDRSRRWAEDDEDDYYYRGPPKAREPAPVEQYDPTRHMAAAPSGRGDRFEGMAHDGRRQPYPVDQPMGYGRELPRGGRGFRGRGRGHARGRGGIAASTRLDARSLRVDAVPPRDNNIGRLNEYFGKFGKIQNIKIDVGSASAEVQFVEVSSAAAAVYAKESPLGNSMITVHYEGPPGQHVAPAIPAEERKTPNSPSGVTRVLQQDDATDLDMLNRLDTLYKVHCRKEALLSKQVDDQRRALENMGKILAHMESSANASEAAPSHAAMEFKRKRANTALQLSELSENLAEVLGSVDKVVKAHKKIFERGKECGSFSQEAIERHAKFPESLDEGKEGESTGLRIGRGRGSAVFRGRSSFVWRAPGNEPPAAVESRGRRPYRGRFRGRRRGGYRGRGRGRGRGQYGDMQASLEGGGEGSFAEGEELPGSDALE